MGQSFRRQTLQGSAASMPRRRERKSNVDSACYDVSQAQAKAHANDPAVRITTAPCKAYRTLLLARGVAPCHLHGPRAGMRKLTALSSRGTVYAADSVKPCFPMQRA